MSKSPFAVVAVVVVFAEVLASAPGVERRTYPGLRHELHNEPEGPSIIDEMIVWLRNRVTIEPQPNTASGERLAR